MLERWRRFGDSTAALRYPRRRSAIASVQAGAVLSFDFALGGFDRDGLAADHMPSLGRESLDAVGRKNGPFPEIGTDFLDAIADAAVELVRRHVVSPVFEARTIAVTNTSCNPGGLAWRGRDPDLCGFPQMIRTQVRRGERHEPATRPVMGVEYSARATFPGLIAARRRARRPKTDVPAQGLDARAR